MFAPPRRLARHAARVASVFIGVLLTATAAAQTVDTPTLRWRGADGVTRDAPPLALAIDADVSGLLAEVRVTQRFTNDGTTWREGQYLLPLPEGAAVHTLKLKIGARVIEGEIREKEQARAEYQAAAAAGQRTSLVEQDQPNLFRTAVANVAPGESVEIEVGYWQRVRYRDGRFQLTFPLGPRTDAYSQQLATMPPDGVDPTLTGSSARVHAGEVRVSVALEPGLPVQSIESLSHPINVDRVGTGFAIRLHDGVAIAARELELGWRVTPDAAPQAALFVEHAPDADYALVMLLAPTRDDAPRLPRELVLVIDTSGSMLGVAMEQAKAAADLALSRLAPGDRFNVIQFNSILERLHPAPVAATGESVSAARAWVAALTAGGGTEMLPALDAALEGDAPAGHVRQVVFVTDGAVTEEDGLYTLIEDGLGAARLFPVGIGDAPNARFLEQAARMGRGAGVVIRDLGEVQARMQELFDKLDRPTLRDVALDWPGASEVYPARLPDLYAGEPLIAVARLPKATGSTTAGKLKASGIQANSAWHRELGLARARNDRGVARLWAKSRIDALEDELRRGADEALIRPQIVDVALAQHLVTRYTSLVAVDRTPARPQHAALEGLGEGADTLAFAQGATAAPLAALLGMLGALLVIFGRFVPARALVTGGRRHA